MTEPTEAAIQKGFDSFLAAFGRVPGNCRLMTEHAPVDFKAARLRLGG